MMTRILPLIDDAQLRDLLYAALQPRYEVIPSSNTHAQAGAAMLDQSFDVAIVDEAALDRLWRRIAARKEAEAPVHLPLLLVTLRDAVKLAAPHLREHIDDFLVVPFDHIELETRITTMLRIRRLSIERNRQPTRSDAREQEALRDSEERFRAVFEQAAVGMARVAPDGAWLDVNQKVCDIVGYTKEELLARTFQDITYPADLNTDLEFVRQMLAGELQTYRMDKRYVRKNGSLVWIRLTVSLVREPSGVPKYFISVIEDIDQRKAIQSALYASERRFSTLVNNLPALVYRCRNDPQWTTEYVSEGVFALTGYRAEDFTINRKVSFGELIHPDDRERVWSDVQQCIEARRPYRTTYRIITAQGHHRWMWEQGAGTFDEAGNLLTLDGVVLDITDRQRAEQQLSDSAARYRAIFEGAGASLWEEDFSAIYADVMTLGSQHGAGLRAWLDAHPGEMLALVQRIRIVDVNSATLKLFGATSKEALLSGLAQIFVPETIPVFRDELLALVGGATTFNAEAEVGTLSNERRTVLLSLTVVPSEHPWERILVSLLDISEMKTYRDRLESHVAQRTAQLQASNKELESFCYSVSHDLRAPLRGINGFTRMLLEDYGDTLDETAHSYLDRVQQAAIDMGELIDALLELSRVTRGEIKRVPINLSVIARQVMETLHQANPQRSVEVMISPDMMVFGDPALLRAASENLLGNAWKYTSKIEHARIEFRMETRGATPVFCVADYGAGFDMKHAAKLFGAFQRLHSAAEFPGTGVGLATVERIVRQHGGRIWAEGEVNKGARFYFTLQA